MNEISFTVAVHGHDAGYTARAELPDDDQPITARGKHRDELIQNIHEAIAARFQAVEPEPGIIHLHFVRDEP